MAWSCIGLRKKFRHTFTEKVDPNNYVVSWVLHTSLIIIQYLIREFCEFALQVTACQCKQHYLFIYFNLFVRWKLISDFRMINCTIKPLRICQWICFYGKSLQKERHKEVHLLPRTGTDWNCKRGNIIRLERSRQRHAV